MRAKATLLLGSALTLGACALTAGGLCYPMFTAADSAHNRVLIRERRDVTTLKAYDLTTGKMEQIQCVETLIQHRDGSF